MDFLWWVELYYSLGLAYFGFVSLMNLDEEIPRPWVFYTIGLFTLSTFWLPLVIAYTFSNKGRQCGKCNRPLKIGQQCPYCESDEANA